MSFKTAFITGASRGIGAAVAEQLAKMGFHLAINSRQELLLEQKAEYLAGKYHIRCLPFAGDVSDAQFLRQTFETIEKEFGALDVLVNNAGISYIGLLSEMKEEEWNQVLQTNLTSVFLCCKYAIPQMLRKKSGKIISISSVWGNVGASCEVAYSASKGGVNAFTKALAKELAPSNIQVNAVACGVIDTEMNRCFTREEREELEAEIPMGRFGSTQEAARVVGLLIEEPGYLTGQIITLDGGWT